MTSDTIFYIGLAVTAGAVLWLVAGLTVLKFRAQALKSVLDEEYGREKKKRGVSSRNKEYIPTRKNGV